MEEMKNLMTDRERQVLQGELDDLRINKRKEIAEKITPIKSGIRSKSGKSIIT